MSVTLGQDDDQTIDLYICVILRDWEYSIDIDNVKAMFDDMGEFSSRHWKVSVLMQ